MKTAEPDNPHFDNICAAMSDASFYPHPTDRIEKRETHISVVFLTGDVVYKLKKPVNPGFLDFRELSARKFYCHREASLNQRLSTGVYSDVVSIYIRKDGGYSFEPHGEPAEYAVKMRQLSENACLKSLIQQKNFRPDCPERIGCALADFYAASQRNDAINHFGGSDSISGNMEENFRQLASFSDIIANQEKWEFIRMVSIAFLKSKRRLFQKRIDEGYIRDGHGDLRTDHIYFDNGLQIIDCIEFNDRFRYGDAALDLSFLHMDLEHLGYPEISRQILLAYMKRSRDFGVCSVLDFYAAYRAIVRLKVCCLQLKGKNGCLENDIRQYLRQAYRYSVQFARPTLWIFCGIPGSGKSTMARHIAEANLLPVFGSDVIRKHTQGFDHSAEAYGQGEYSADRRSRVYARMLAKAQEALKEGHSAAIDATFSLRKWRDEARQLAGDLDTDIIFVQCFCTDAALRSRLKHREHKPGMSDARIEHLKDIMENFEPLNELPENIFISVSTDQPIPEAAAQIISEGYACKMKQVKALLPYPCL